MILNDEQLSFAVHGWVEKETIDGYTYFYRFTKMQRDYYASRESNPKQLASSGEFMEFVTDADAVNFDFVQFRASSQNFYFFDVYVNGKFVHHQGRADYAGREEGRFEQPLPGGENTVRIYFPNLSATGLKNVELAGATVFRPVEKSLKYIAYGDSITQGYTATSPSLTYANITAMELDADLYNLGIGGEFFQPNMVDDNYPVKADIVTVAYGTNDWKKIAPADDAERRKGFFENLLKAHKGSKIFVILPVWRGNGQENHVTGYGTLNDYRDGLRKEMEQYPEITVIEGLNLVPHHPDFYVPDMLHPNALGFTQYAKNVLAELKKHL